MRQLKYAPSGFWKLDDTTPFQDYSGYNKSATVGGTERHGIALCPSNAFSQYFSETVKATFATDVYLQGKESKSFTMEATVLPTGTGTARILSHGTSTDGLSISGNVVSFATRYTNNGFAFCNYTLQDLSKITIHGVHTEFKNSLYINGELVDEVDITPEQQADTYWYNANTIQSGGGDTSILVNNVAIYPYDLSANAIKDIYEGNKQNDESIINLFDGKKIDLSFNPRQAYINMLITDADDWESAEFIGCVTDGNQVSAEIFQNQTTMGTWIKAVELRQSEVANPVYSIDLWWEGKNITVDTSVNNGTTWVAATKGQNITSITPPYTPTNPTLLIRVNFQGGLDESYIDNIRVRGYLSSSVVVDNRTLTLSNATSRADHDVTEFVEDNGVYLNSGSLTISGDTNDPIRTVEVWYKKASNLTLSSNFTGATRYVNGISGGTDQDNEWQVTHYVMTANTTADIVISGTAQIGSIVLYPSALTQANINTIIAGYTGSNVVRASVANAVAVSEPASAASVYAYDWQIISARAR